MDPRITLDPKIHHGQPVITGTRVPVAIIVGSLAGGMTSQEIQHEYRVTEDDVRAALGYAAQLVEGEQHHLLPV